MSTALIVLVAAVAFWGEAGGVGANKRPPKCCPIGQVLNSTLGCEFTSSSLLLVANDVPNHYPNCAQENITTEAAVQGKQIMCLDKVLGTDKSVRDSAKLVGLACSTENETTSSDIFDVPEVVSVKKCCSPERKYDDYRTGCWSKNVKNDVETIEKLLESLLNDSVTPSYTDITYGAPICKSDEVLVDYKIPKYQVLLLESEAIRMRIPGHSEFIILPPESICVDIHAQDDLTVVVRACQDEKLTCNNHRNTCVRKCCPDGQSMFYNRTCLPSKKVFNPQFYTNVDTSNVKTLSDVDVHPSLVYGRKCNDVYFLEPWDNIDDVRYLDTNGELYAPAFKKYYNRDKYCIEYLTSTKYNISKLVTFVCFPEFMPVFNQSNNSIYLVAVAGDILSCFFLLLTLIVYSCLPHLQNIHGKTVMCFIVSLLLAYITLSVTQIGSAIFDFNKDERLCRSLGYTTMFLFLATFSWLNVLCFDIWYTFGSVRSSFARRTSNTKSRRFLYYNIYAWGVAGLITLITVVTDYAALLGYLYHMWVSDFGIVTCWFSKVTYGIILYFIMPVGIQMVINLLLFILTIRHYFKVKSAIDKMHNNTGAKQRYNADKRKFTMAIKLFIMMGISWILEILSHIIDPASTVWIFSDIVNAMQGLLIFLLLVFKRKIIKGIADRTREILPCYSEEKKPPKTRSSSSTIFTTISSECKLSSVKQK